MAAGHGVCPETDKVIFYSVKEVRESLVGAMRGRRITAYPCPDHPGHFHMSKEPPRYNAHKADRKHKTHKMG